MLRGVRHIFNLIVERRIDSTFAPTLIVLDKVLWIFQLLLNSEKSVDLVLGESFGERTSHDAILWLVQTSTAHCQRIIVEHIWME